jgi:hypothetical protein
MTSRERALLVLVIVGFAVPNVFVGIFITDKGRRYRGLPLARHRKHTVDAAPRRSRDRGLYVLRLGGD